MLKFNMKKVFFKRVLLIAIYLHVVYSIDKSLNDTKTLIEDLLAKHQKYARPVENQDDTLNVTVMMFFKSIQEFDEIQERFSYVAGIRLWWKDAGMVWDPLQYGGVEEIEISWKEVWTPELILTNPAKEIKSFGQKWQTVHYNNTGHASWLPGSLLETNCPINARNFPFDTQICTTSLTALGSNSKKIWLNRATNEVNTSIFQGHGAWSLLKTSVRSFDWAGTSQIEFTFPLKLKPGFVIINIVLPILFLSLLNVLVFVLVPESGERVSFCITVLLSIAVFLTIVSDTLPKTSEPVPIISYKLMVDMILSSLATVVTICNLAIYNKRESEPKPNWILNIYRCVYCKKKCTENQVCPNNMDTIVTTVNESRPSSAHKRTTLTEFGDTEIKPACTCDKNITWKDISRMVDRVFLILFSFATLTSFAVFMLVAATS